MIEWKAHICGKPWPRKILRRGSTHLRLTP